MQNKKRKEVIKNGLYNRFNNVCKWFKYIDYFENTGKE